MDCIRLQVEKFEQVRYSQLKIIYKIQLIKLMHEISSENSRLYIIQEQFKKKEKKKKGIQLENCPRNLNARSGDVYFVV